MNYALLVGLITRERGTNSFFYTTKNQLPIGN